ncbi:hypothetical protein ACNJGJ_21285, partial [Mycobacterium tuberculosis]
MRAVALYEAESSAIIAREVVQLATGERDPARFATVAGQDLFERGAMRPLTPEETSSRLETATPALAMAGARVIAPGEVIAAWSGPVL